MDVEKLSIVANPAAASFERQPVRQSSAPRPEDGVDIFKSAAVPPPVKDSVSPIAIPLVPFADAGMTGAAYKVWLPLKKK